MAAIGPSTTPVSSGGHSSIQILLDAEKEASVQVNQARQCIEMNIFSFLLFLVRVQRLKDARTQAEAEIEELKAKKKEEFIAYEKTVVSGLDETIVEQTRMTEVELGKTRSLAQSNREAILKLLIDKVLSVEPQLHPNALIKKQ